MLIIYRKEFMGECDKDTSFEVLDAFFDLGGNFIDTANAYQCEESEEWLGEWMEKKGNRDQMVYVYSPALLQDRSANLPTSQHCD